MKKILIVDDEKYIRELVSTTLKGDEYQTLEAGNGEEAIVVARREMPDLILLDIRMPKKDGLEVCRELKSDPETSSIPIVILTAYGQEIEKERGKEAGADDYFVKPFSPLTLLKKIEELLGLKKKVTHIPPLPERLKGLSLAEELRLTQRQSIVYADELHRTYLAEKDKAKRLEKALKEIEEAYDATLVALVNALDAREHEVQAHSQRVCEYTMTLARGFGVAEEELPDIKRGSLLHDVGKIGISDNILLKPGPLTPEEWVEMKKHPYIGYKILEGIKFLEGAVEIVYAHQEKYDGTGYPRGLKGEEIPLGARLFAVVDTLDAMTSDRPYRKALTYEIARDEIIRCTGTQFDPKAADVFLGIPKEEWMGIREGIK